MKKITLTGTDGKTFQIAPGEIRYVLTGGIVRGPRKLHAVTSDSAKLAQEAICCWNLEDYPVGTNVTTWGQQVGLRKQPNGLFVVNGTNRMLATRLVEAGVDIEDVSRLLGHTDLDFTRIYVIPSKETIREAFESAL